MNVLSDKWNSFKYKRSLSILFVPFGLILTNLAYFYPFLTERLYSQGVYKFFAQTLGRFFSLFPLSIGELFIFFGVIFLIFFFFKFLYSLLYKNNNKQIITAFFVNIITITSCLYFAFVVLCGLNYARPHYKDLMNLTVTPSSIEELENLCTGLIDDANRQKKIVDSKYSTSTIQDLEAQAQKIYSGYSKSQNELFFPYSPKPKSVLNSKIMSRVNITGVYFPYTFECNINTHVPLFTIPATMLHEISHYHGFMQEAEANFLAYKVSQQEDYPEFAYSGTMMALINSTNAYYSATSQEEYSDLLSKLSPGVQKDLKLSYNYWKDFETPIADFGQKVNDTYLKVQKQKDGIKSYGNMVDLLLAEERQKKTSIR